jgi:hypothetical protein
MLKFPTIKKVQGPRLSPMSLREYAEYCEACLRSNPAITPENCMTKRTDEATMPPFRLPPRQEGVTESL